ncbi:MAG: hypothetical protein K2P93_08295 [Alphaproteobacteria bacterium]|nr:hypothetical protein [Alphaproteobacteria bacterium]
MANNFCFRMSFVFILLINLSLPSRALLEEYDEDPSLVPAGTRRQAFDEEVVLVKQQETYWQKKKAELNDKLLSTIGSTSAMIIYPTEKKEIRLYDPDKRSHIKVPINYPLALLNQVDTILFNETTILRAPVACCHLKILTGIKGMAFVLGGTAFPLITAALCNGILGRLFDYEVGGPVSYTMLGLSIAVAGPEGGIKLLKGARFALHTKRSTFQVIPREDDESALYVPYIHRKSNSHKAVDILSFTAAVLYGLTPTVLWLIVEDPFPEIALSLALPLLIYSAESYWRVIKKATWKWFCQSKYIDLQSKLIRQAFLEGLNRVGKAIAEEQENSEKQLLSTQKTKRTPQSLLQEEDESDDPERRPLLTQKFKGTPPELLQEESEEREEPQLTHLLYECLRVNSNDFGNKHGSENVKEGEMVSPLSLLTTPPLAIPELSEPTPTLLRRLEKILESSEKKPKMKLQEIRQALKMDAPFHTTPSEPLRKLIARHCASALSWLSVIPDAAMCAYGLSKGLPFLGVGETTAKVVGIITAIPATLKLIPERLVHQRTFDTLSHPLTPEPEDFRKSRISLTGKAALDATFKALVYGTLTYWALAGNNDLIRGFFVAVSIARFFSIFFTSNLDTYNETFTELVIGRGKNPSLERKKARILDCLEKASTAIGTDLLNETVGQIDTAGSIKQGHGIKK